MRRFPVVLLAAVLVAGCDNGHSTPVAGIIAPTGGATATPTAAGATPAPTATPTTSSSTSCASPTMASIGAAGGSITAMAGSGSIAEQLPSGDFTTSTAVTFCYVASSALPAPLLRSPHEDAQTGRREPMFTAGAGNTYVAAFTTSFGGTTLTTAAGESGTGVVPATIAAGTQLNIAMYNGTTWVDVATAVVSATGTYQSTVPSATLPGVKAAGTYLVYLPAAGTNTSQLNLGFALVADDGTASVANGLQFVQLEDGNGNPLPTPTTTYFPVSGSDLDGQSLTPDAQQGAAVDGGDNVYFFSGIPAHTFTLANAPISVSAYGGDGDSIVSLPNGDEAVVTADGGEPFAVISGILSGMPVISDTVNPSGTSGSFASRDGLVISNDGKTMLARGSTGIDVYNITQVAAHAGSTGMGTTSYNFTLAATLPSSGATTDVPDPQLEDGRDDMAMSPVDDTRAVVVGPDSTSDKPTIVLLTGLNTSTPAINSLHLQFTPRQRRFGQMSRHPEAMPHRAPLALTPSAGSALYAVSISPDGKTAFVSTDAGIITVSGVDTGTLAQVGTVYSPALTVPGGGTCLLESASSIGVLPDGKFLIADVNCGLAEGTTDSSQGSGVMVTIPIGAGGVLGAPVGQLNNVVTPNNDQIIFH